MQIVKKSCVITTQKIIICIVMIASSQLLLANPKAWQKKIEKKLSGDFLIIDFQKQYLPLVRNEYSYKGFFLIYREYQETNPMDPTHDRRRLELKTLFQLLPHLQNERQFQEFTNTVRLNSPSRCPGLGDSIQRFLGIQ